MLEIEILDWSVPRDNFCNTEFAKNRYKIIKERNTQEE